MPQQKLEAGEKYLSIAILGSVKCAAFKNKNKRGPKDPDYIGNGIAIWITQKRESGAANKEDI